MKKLLLLISILFHAAIVSGQSVKWNRITTNSDAIAMSIVTNVSTDVTYQRGKVNNFNRFAAWPKVIAETGANTEKPIQVFGWGEGGHFSDTYATLMQRMWQRAPVGGIIGAFGNWQTYTFAGGGYLTNDNYWYVAHPYLPAGASVNTTNVQCTVSNQIVANVVGVDFLRNTNCAFTLYTRSTSYGNIWTNRGVYSASNELSGGTIWWTNTAGPGVPGPIQVMVSNHTTVPLEVLSLNLINDSSWGVIAIPHIQSGGHHWVGFFNGNLQTNILAPIWSNWCAFAPTVMVYHEFVAQTNWTHYLPKFYNWTHNVAQLPEIGYVFCNAAPDDGENESAMGTLHGADTNLLNAAHELHDFAVTNRLRAGGFPWTIGVFDTFSLFGGSASNALYNGLINPTFDTAYTVAGDTMFGHALYDYLWGAGDFDRTHYRTTYIRSLQNGVPALLKVDGEIQSGDVWARTPGSWLKFSDSTDSYTYSLNAVGLRANFSQNNVPLWNYYNSGGENQFNFLGVIHGSNAVAFGVSRTNILTDSGSRLNGVGITNRTVTANFWDLPPAASATTHAAFVKIWNSNNAALYVRGTNGADKLLLAIP